MGSPPSDQNQANPPNSDSPPSNNSVSSPPPPDSSSSDSTSPPAPPQVPTLTSPSPSPPSISRSPNRPTKTLTPQPQPSQSPPPPSTNGKQPSPLSSPSLPQSSNSPTTPSNGSSTNNAPFVAGALAGLGVLIVLCVVVLVASCRRKRKKSHDHEDYFNEQANMKDHDFKHNSKWPNRASHQSFNMPNQPAMGWPAPPMISTDASENYSTGPRQAAVPPPHPLVALGLNKNSFTYDELAGATQGFSQANVLGQGGFGFVYKGVLPNGKEIAVKSLKSGSGQGEREFQAEVDIISRVHHRHLVSLVGYCIAGGQRMLVYEFVPNNTLEFHLHGKGQPPMDFPLRLKIALGSAKGLAYLHEDCHPRIIHRDIKTANILLDQDFEAKVADFGLAKLSNDNNTHVSTRVMGTFGYLAPEYASSGKLTNKSDVFSFGVVLLELITGRRPINPTGDDDGLVDWARPQLARVLDEGNFEGVVDPRLENNFNTQEMTRLVACAAASIRHSSKKRPKMSQIVRALEGDMSLEALNEGVKPGQTMYFGGEAVTSEYNASLYRRDMEKFKRALDSDESNTSSSEYGASSNS